MTDSDWTIVLRAALAAEKVPAALNYEWRGGTALFMGKRFFPTLQESKAIATVREAYDREQIAEEAR